MRRTKQRALPAMLLALILTAGLTGCTDNQTDRSESFSTEDGHICPPCPEYPPGKSPPSDPLAGSEIEDGLTDAERTKFIRDNISATLRITIARYVEDQGARFAGGTGVAIRPNLVLTAAHVMNRQRLMFGTQRILARDNLTINRPRASFLRILETTNELQDIALLQLADGETLPNYLPITMGRRIRQGQLLWHFGRTTRWARGHVIDTTNPRMIRVRFRVAGGDSGGPVVWPDGHLAGIILSRSIREDHIIDDNTSSVGFFITIDEAIRAISEARLRW